MIFISIMCLFKSLIISRKKLWTWRHHMDSDRKTMNMSQWTVLPGCRVWSGRVSSRRFVTPKSTVAFNRNNEIISCLLRDLHS